MDHPYSFSLAKMIDTDSIDEKSPSVSSMLWHSYAAHIMAGIAPPVLTRMKTGDGEGFLGQQRRLLSEPLLEICQEPVQGCLLHGEASPKLMTTWSNYSDLTTSLWIRTLTFEKVGMVRGV